MNKYYKYAIYVNNKFLEVKGFLSSKDANKYAKSLGKNSFAEFYKHSFANLNLEIKK
jgi:hypothetical protein